MSRSGAIVVAARLACLFSAALLAWTLNRANQDIAAPKPGTTYGIAPQAGIQPQLGLNLSLVASTVDQDPFQPTRSRPSERFLLPGEGLPAEVTSQKSVAESDSLRLVGTALVGPDGGFAICRRGLGEPLLVRIGRSIDSLTLIRLEPGRAIFQSVGGKHIQLLMPKSGT